MVFFELLHGDGRRKRTMRVSIGSLVPVAGPPMMADIESESGAKIGCRSSIRHLDFIIGQTQ